MVARICVGHFVVSGVRARQQIRLVEGNNPHVAVPDDLFVPVNVKLVRVGLVQDGLEKAGCILGGSILQTFVGTFVRGHPGCCVGAGNEVLVFVLCLPGEDATFGVRLRHGVKQDMTRRPSGHRQSIH